MVGISTYDSVTLAVDSSGSVVLAGAFEGAADFGGGTLTPPPGGITTAFVAEYERSGAYVWAQQYPGVVDAGIIGSEVWGVAFDPSGNVVVTGFFLGTIDFGTGPLMGNDGLGDVFLAKLGPTGSGIWAEEFAGNVITVGVAVDSSGGVTLAGNLGGYSGDAGVNFGGGVLTAAGYSSVVLADFDSSGTYRWSTVAGGSPSFGGSFPIGLAGNGASVTVFGGFGCGNCQGPTLVLDDDTLTGGSSEDLIVASFVR